MEIKRKILHGMAVLLMVCCNFVRLSAQSDTPDELFQEARTAAFKEKNYPRAVDLVLRALEQAPEYSDIRVFLGRLYSWSGQYDNAKEAFVSVLKKDAAYEDASVALTDLEYWNDHYDKALMACDEGLVYHPESKELQLRRAKILNALHRYREAHNVASELVGKYPGDDTVLSLLRTIRFDSAKNKVSISHDCTWFDGNYGSYLHDYPWHIVGLDYVRYTSIGSVITRVNYGNRFGKEAFQFEMDSYPRLLENISAYINAGISNQSAVFPRYRVGMSLYASLPHSFEAEAGFRLLHFSGNTFIYVGSIAKYYKNFWFNGRMYLVPGDSKVSHSYSLITRYYYGGADDYWKFKVGYGLSPDEVNVVQDFSSSYKLKSAYLSVGLRKSIHKLNVVDVTVSVVRQEFDKNEFGTQLSSSLTYIRKF